MWNDNSTEQTFIPDLASIGSYNFDVTVENQFGCTSEDDINIEVDDCAELSILNADDIIFYPNPFKDVVYSNVNLEEYDIEIYDIIGRKLSDYRIITNSIVYKGPSGLLRIRIKDKNYSISNTILAY